MKKLFTIFLLAALSGFSADVTGNWKGTAEGPNGKMERTFSFKVEGSKLTGETSSEMLGKSTIQDGKVDGDSLSFSVHVNFQGQDVKILYRGKVSGKQLKLNVQSEDGSFSTDYVAERIP